MYMYTKIHVLHRYFSPASASKDLGRGLLLLLHLLQWRPFVTICERTTAALQLAVSDSLHVTSLSRLFLDNKFCFLRQVNVVFTSLLIGSREVNDIRQISRASSCIILFYTSIIYNLVHVHNWVRHASSMCFARFLIQVHLQYITAAETYVHILYIVLEQYSM